MHTRRTVGVLFWGAVVTVVAFGAAGLSTLAPEVVDRSGDRDRAVGARRGPSPAERQTVASRPPGASRPGEAGDPARSRAGDGGHHGRATGDPLAVFLDPTVWRTRPHEVLSALEALRSTEAWTDPTVQEKLLRYLEDVRYPLPEGSGELWADLEHPRGDAFVGRAIAERVRCWEPGRRDPNSRDAGPLLERLSEALGAEAAPALSDLLDAYAYAGDASSAVVRSALESIDRPLGAPLAARVADRLGGPAGFEAFETLLRMGQEGRDHAYRHLSDHPRGWFASAYATHLTPSQAEALRRSCRRSPTRTFVYLRSLSRSNEEVRSSEATAAVSEIFRAFDAYRRQVDSVERNAYDAALEALEAVAPYVERPELVRDRAKAERQWMPAPADKRLNAAIWILGRR